MLATLLATAAAATSVGVAEREFSISLYRARVPRGSVKFNVTNFGEDAHNLVVKQRGKVLARSHEIRAGERGVLRVRFRRTGTYRLACTVADHEEIGMKAKLRVVARR